MGFGIESQLDWFGTDRIQSSKSGLDGVWDRIPKRRVWDRIPKGRRVRIPKGQSLSAGIGIESLRAAGIESLSAARDRILLPPQ